MTGGPRSQHDKNIFCGCKLVHTRQRVIVADSQLQQVLLVQLGRNELQFDLAFMIIGANFSEKIMRKYCTRATFGQ